MGKLKRQGLLLIIFITFLSVISVFAANPAGKKGKSKEKKGKAGLSLESRIQREAVETVKPNRHIIFGCLDCHLFVPDKEQANNADAPKEAPLKYDTFQELCTTACHPLDRVVHPANLLPSDKIAERIPAQIFPLGKREGEKGFITCNTCHDLHREMGTNYMLRGTPLKVGDKNVSFPDQGTFCQGCHGEEITKLSPHYENKNENLCYFCHTYTPKEGEEDPNASLVPDISRTCNFCHNATENSHFLAVNPFADKDLTASIPASLPRVDGAYTCITCHYSHKGDGNTGLVRKDFVAFAEKSRRINPHWTKLFCLSCHDKKPAASEPASFNFDSTDVSQACNWCHDAFYARISLHKTGKKPPLPEDEKRYKLTHFDFNLFKLNKKGEVACATCHRRDCEQTKESTGPNFLVGGPYKKANEQCFKCHVKEEFQKIDCHKGQVDEEGKPILEKCLFCHESDPTKELEGIKRVNFIAQIRLLCMRCHDEFGHPGTDIKTGEGIDHLKQYPTEGNPDHHLKPLKEVPLDVLPLTDNNFVTCSTCHNSHQARVIEGKRGEGAGVKQRKRTSIMKGELCESCHNF